MRELTGAKGGWIELESPSGGCTIALDKAAAIQTSGPTVKIVFSIADVRAFVAAKLRGD